MLDLIVIQRKNWHEKVYADKMTHAEHRPFSNGDRVALDELGYNYIVFVCDDVSEQDWRSLTGTPESLGWLVERLREKEGVQEL